MLLAEVEDRAAGGAGPTVQAWQEKILRFSL